MEKRQQKELIAVRVTGKFKNELINIANDKGWSLPDLIKFILGQYVENERNNKNN